MTLEGKYSNYQFYYVHGYLSNPEGIKAKLLRKKLGVIPIKYRNCVAEDIVISDCLKEMEHSGRISKYRRKLFQELLHLRNRAIHQPGDITEKDINAAVHSLNQLEDQF